MQGSRDCGKDVFSPLPAISGERFHPILVPSRNGNDDVRGKVFRITARELAAADEYEVADDKRIEVN